MGAAEELKEIREDLKSLTESSVSMAHTMEKQIESTGEIKAALMGVTETMQNVLTSLAVRDQQDQAQAEFNAAMKEELSGVKKRVHDIELSRAEEKPSRDFLKKWFPMLFVCCILLSTAVALIPKSILSAVTGP